MIFDVWTVVRFLHVVSAILWVGGQLTLSLIVRPVAKEALEEDLRIHLSNGLGSRFGRISAIGLIPILLATGLSLTYHRGVTAGYLGLPGYGTTLGFKIALALLSFGLAAGHGMTAVRSSTRAIRIIGITGALVSVAVVLLAVSLVP